MQQKRKWSYYKTEQHSYVLGPKVHIGFSGDLNFTESDMKLIALAPELLEFAEEVRRTGDTRLASMAIALINKTTRD